MRRQRGVLWESLTRMNSQATAEFAQEAEIPSWIRVLRRMETLRA